MKQVHRIAQKSLFDSLGPEQIALARSFGDTGAAALQPPRRAEHLLDNDEFTVVLRCKLLMVDPAGAGGAPCANVGRQSRAPCNSVDGQQYAKHALDCPIGGGLGIRHNGCRDALASWLEEQHGQSSARTEQRIPQWDRETDEGTQHAVLDVIVCPPGGRVAIDVSVVDVLAVTPAEARARARTNGAAARDRERQKHRRYPGAGLVAAAIETGGRFGRELQAFLRESAPADVPGRSTALTDIRQRLAAALWRGNAAMILSSAGQRPRPWPVLGQFRAAVRGAS